MGPTGQRKSERGGSAGEDSRRRRASPARGGHGCTQERMVVLPRGFSLSAGGRSYVGDVRQRRELVGHGEERAPVTVLDGALVCEHHGATGKMVRARTQLEDGHGELSARRPHGGRWRPWRSGYPPSVRR